MNKQKLLMAAVAGIALGASAPDAQAEVKDDVKCWGINSCGSHAGCNVSDAELGAVKKLVGEKEYTAKYGKSKTHSCASHASCGASKQILNWTKVSSAECKERGGLLVEDKEGQKVAKKAE